MTFEEHVVKAERWLLTVDTQFDLTAREMIAIAAVHVSLAQAIGGREAVQAMQKVTGEALAATNDALDRFV
jgi:hypothetical protein